MVISDKRVVDWLIPALLAGLLSVLAWMGTNLQDISQSLAVAVVRVDNLDARVQNLETQHYQR